MKVHTYHFPIPGSGAEPVIELWRESWSAQGWTPVVLTEVNVRELPFFCALQFKARMLPTINDHRYHFACFARYLAMAGVSGGMTTDYDVINFGFKPADVPPHNGKLMRFNRQSPCAMFGSTWNYLQCVDMFLSYTPQPDDLFGDRLVVQDQEIMNRYAHIADYQDVCSEHRADNSNRDRLIHFATACCGGRNKAEVIREYVKGRPG